MHLLSALFCQLPVCVASTSLLSCSSKYTPAACDTHYVPAQHTQACMQYIVFEMRYLPHCSSMAQNTRQNTRLACDLPFCNPASQATAKSLRESAARAEAQASALVATATGAVAALRVAAVEAELQALRVGISYFIFICLCFICCSRASHLFGTADFAFGDGGGQTSVKFSSDLLAPGLLFSAHFCMAFGQLVSLLLLGGEGLPHTPCHASPVLLCCSSLGLS